MTSFTGSLPSAENVVTGDAQIVEQKPEQRIAWKATSGIGNAGVVTFHRIDANTTRIMLQLEMYSEDGKEKLADFTGMVKKQAKKDLERFKEYIESRGTETGAWRGEIPQKRAG
jgi:uncharacterized membrane protein